MLDLPPSTDSVPAARRFVRARLLDVNVDVDVATLLVSEVVTNAILHARTGVTLTVDQHGATAHIAVHDGSPLHPRPHEFSATSATGRGLRLLDQLAARWGVESDRERGGKVVWFEVGRPSDQAWSDHTVHWSVEGLP